MGKEESPQSIDLTLTHDGYFREGFQIKRLAKAFLKKALPKRTIRRLDLDGLTVEERHLTDELFKDKVADVIYRVPIKGTKEYVNFFVIVEHKSRQDWLTIFQLWCYVYLICRRAFQATDDRKKVKENYRLPPVIAIIVYHGIGNFRGKTELADLFLQLPGLDEYLPRMKAILFDLNEIADDDPILNDPESPELRVVLMAMKVIFRRDVATKVSDVIRELKLLSDDPIIQRLLRTTFVYLVNNAKHLKRNADALIGTFREVVGEKTMSTLAETWKAEGKAEGVAIGEARGKAEGKAETVLTVLRARFRRVPKRVEDTIRQMTDPIAIDSWAEHAATCQSLEEFEKALR